MQLSKSGIISLLIGLAVLGATLQYAYAGSVAALLVNGLALGGIAWLGLILLIVGILIILI